MVTSDFPDEDRASCTPWITFLRAARTEEGAELAFDEAGQADPVGARGDCGEEGLQVLPDHSVQDRVGGSAGYVGSHGARGPAASVP
jgi:hypothetical protein